MFANAGVVSRGGVPGVLGGEHVEVEDYPLADWNAVIVVNLTGVFPDMPARGRADAR
jgi:hypothetical protein